MPSFSSTVGVFNLLQGTGLVAAENAFPVRGELNKRGGTFLQEGCGQVSYQEERLDDKDAERRSRTHDSKEGR